MPLLPSEVRPYTPLLLTAIFGEVDIQGPGDGSFLTIEMVDDGLMELVGIDGGVTVSQNLNEMGQVTLHLAHLSPTNELLRGIYNENRLAWGTGFRPFRLQDGNGSLIATCPQMWITKLPNIELADQPSAVDWVLRGSPFRMLDVP